MKRIAVFLLLLALGFLLLKLALGDEQIATAGGSDRKTPPAADRPQGQPIRVQQDGTELQLRGGFLIAPQRRIPRPGGGFTFQSTYELGCKDSAPLDGNRHRLDEMTMKLFDKGEHVADLTASRAIVELQVDEQHNRALREDKEIDLEDFVLTTVPDGRLAPMRLEIGRVRAIFDTDLITLKTPDENAPVRVVVDGAHKGELRGRGLNARMPKDRNAALGRFDLLILHDPEVAMAGVAMTAKGQLHYVEQLATGAALLTVDDDVRVALAGRGAPGTTDAAATRGGLDVRGDRMRGWLQRSRRGGPGERGAADDAGHDALLWTMLRLHGSRAKVTTADLELESPRLTVLPGPTGEMASVTADNGPSELRRPDGNGGQATFRSPRPIHLVRGGAWCGAIYRSFGFPAFTLGPLADLEIVSFDGASEVDAGDGVRVSADRGLHLFRQPSAAATGNFVARGFGNVVIARGDGSERVEARGDSGFVLWRTHAGDEIVLGSADPAAVQRFELSRGALRLQGSGACTLVRATDGLVRIRLASDRSSIGGTFVDERAGAGTAAIGSIRGARRLDIDVRDSEVLALLAAGPDTSIDFERSGKRLVATAERFEQTATNSWQLLGGDGTPARLRLPPGDPSGDGELTAPRIDLHRITSRSLVVDAHADATAPVRVDVRVLAPGAAMPTHVVTTARRMRLLPFAIGPAALLQQLLGMPRALALTVAGSLGSPWMLADGEVVCDVTDPDHGQLHATASLLALSQGARALLFLGDAATRTPATLERLEQGQRTMLAEGARVRVVAEDTRSEHIEVLTTFPGQDQTLPPRVTFRGAPTAADAVDTAAGWIRGECDGEIEVLPDAVLFHGPVTATSLLADGTDDADGMHITARHMQMNRARDTGKLTSVVADGGVVVAWQQMRAASRRIELDLKWHRCIAEDPDGAEIRFGALVFRAPRLEANYETYAVRSYRGRLVHEAEPAARR